MDYISSLEAVRLSYDDKGGMYVSVEALKDKPIHCSMESATNILGEGVSLEIIRVLLKDYYAPLKVYVSKRGTCCLLAEKYPR